ncbi:MAG: enoyl-CoA hydratase/isomerase family protein [Acidimicrobiia bacterium]
MTEGPLSTSRRDGVCTVTIDIPPHNMVGADFIVGLLEVLAELDADTETRVVVFRSADPDFFLMHGDVDNLLAMPLGQPDPVDEPNFAAMAFERVRRLPMLTVAVIDGAARGGGAEFLAALDLRYATPRAVLGQPEVPMGILPGAGGTTRLPHLLGRGAALEVILTGRDVGADEALALGWVDAVAPLAELDARVDALAMRVARMPRASIAAVKRVVDESLGAIDDALVVETNELLRLTGAGAHLARMTRFKERGGQTREGETQHMDEIVAAMLELDE